MKELFEQLLKLRCTEIYLTTTECRVSFWHGDEGLTITVCTPKPAGLAAAIKAYSETEE